MPSQETIALRIYTMANSEWYPDLLSAATRVPSMGKRSPPRTNRQHISRFVQQALELGCGLDLYPIAVVGHGAL